MTQVNLKTPSENFETIIKILRFSASICGIDLLKANYRMNWITYTLFTSISGYYIFVFLTIWRNYQDDWTIFLRATVTMGSAFQGCSKLFSFISDKQEIYDLHTLLSGIYRDYQNLGDKYREALETSLEKTRNGMYALMLFYVIGYVGVITVPYVFLLVTGERFLVIDFQVPGFDIKTNVGYFATLGFQTVLMICYAFGLYCGDLVALIYLLQSFMFSYIFAAKIDYVNEIAKKSENSENSSVDSAIIDIIEWLQLFSNYTTRCNNLFYYVITVQIVTAFCSTVLSIYLIMDGGWPGAYTYVVVSICSLYQYCILGSENETANKKFEHSIYNINWYNFTAPQQRRILQVLCQTQKPKTIDVAGVMPLSVSTALRLSKALNTLATASNTNTRLHMPLAANAVM